MRLSAALRERGHTPTSAGSLEIALRVLSVLAPDALVVDVGGDGGAALPLLRALRDGRRPKKPKVIMVHGVRLPDAILSELDADSLLLPAQLEPPRLAERICAHAAG